ncbi:MAG: RNA 2',3'-cyclic phosphodiesterase [Pseudomonadota bacterium]
MPRLFSALAVPEEDVDRLYELRRSLPGARWVDPENYHITLQFFGDVDPHTADALERDLAQVSAEPFDVRLSGLGHFGGERARSLWAGVVAGPELAQLASAHRRVARACGLEPERRKFHPHVTIARFASGVRREQRRRGQAGRGQRHSGRGSTSRVQAELDDPLVQFLREEGGWQGAPFTATSARLMSSRSGTGGGIYVVEAELPFVGTSVGDGTDDEARERPTLVEAMPEATQRLSDPVSEHGDDPDHGPADARIMEIDDLPPAWFSDEIERP